MDSPCPSPRASCVEAGLPQGPIHHSGGHTKTSLSSMGVGHQRKGRTESAREEGRKEGRKEEDRTNREGKWEGPMTLAAQARSPGSGNRNC